MVQVHIPATIEEAKANLDGLGKLLTAKEWERAAIVYAFSANRPTSAIADVKLSFTAFSKLWHYRAAVGR